MKISLVFLGTGQAIPTAKRNHTSILLNYKSEKILIDCGEGAQRQFRKAKINQCKLTKILITHWHGDHILGLPGLFQTLALNNYNKELEIYIPKGTRNFLDSILRMFVFQGNIKYKVIECSPGKIFENPDFFIEAEKMDHGTPCLAYSFSEKEKIRIDKEKLKKFKIKGKIISQLQAGKDIELNGKKIKASQVTYTQKGKKITFILDTKLNENCCKIAKNSDLLISEATYTQEDKSAEGFTFHLTARDAAEIAKKAKCKKLILTHISQRYENREKLILDEARKVFKNTELTEDLKEVEI